MQRFFIHLLSITIFAGSSAGLTVAAVGLISKTGGNEQQIHSLMYLLTSTIVLIAIMLWMGTFLVAERLRGRASSGASSKPSMPSPQPLISTLSDTLGELDVARRQLLASERLAAMGYFAGGIAHQIGNPLSAARQYLEAISVQVSAGQEPNPEALDRIKNQLDRIHRAIESLSRFARPDKIQQQQLGLRPFLETIAADIESAWAGTALIKIDVRDDAEVETDILALEQALINVIRNGLEAQQSETCRIQIQVSATAEHLDIVVSDFGPGFPEGFRPEAVLESEKLGGTGLGVPIAVRLVELIGGQIQFNNWEEGARVTIILPVQ